jgi:MYXO-CTERM domain-containing protein
MNTTCSLRRSSALRPFASALALALAATLASGPAAAAASGDVYTLTLTYDSHNLVAPPAVGSFVLDAEVAGHPGVFSVSDFSIVIGVAPDAWDYNELHGELDFDSGTGLFGGAGIAAHAFTSYGDQLDLNSGANLWKTDDFVDFHCNESGCPDFHYGTYAVTAASVPEPGGVGLALAGLGVLAAMARRRRAS